MASVYSGTKYLRKTSNSIILELTNFAGGLSMDVSVGTRLRKGAGTAEPAGQRNVGRPAGAFS